MTIADFRDLLPAQPHLPRAVVYHNKIIPGAIHLGESQHVICVPQGRSVANSMPVILSVAQRSRRIPSRDLKAFATGSLDYARDDRIADAIDCPNLPTRSARSSRSPIFPIKSTIALPTTTASATRATAAACPGLEMPKPTAIGKPVCFLSIVNFCSSDSAIESCAPVTP